MIRTKFNSLIDFFGQKCLFCNRSLGVQIINNSGNTIFYNSVDKVLYSESPLSTIIVDLQTSKVRIESNEDSLEITKDTAPIFMQVDLSCKNCKRFKSRTKTLEVSLNKRKFDISETDNMLYKVSLILSDLYSIEYYFDSTGDSTCIVYYSDRVVIKHLDFLLDLNLSNIDSCITKIKSILLFS